ncbi:hypothetical protein ACQ3VF_26215 [Bacillus toyonensis]|uniref:hypothetical protein n=1 Tax=Bacillus toyonensis TaxID=155322 RepID=UPI003D30232C
MTENQKALLIKLQGVIDELSLECDMDNDFHNLMCDLNTEREVFGSSLDEINIHTFIEEHEEEKPSFEFEGQHITNPYLSECLRFEVKNPCEYYGITPEFLAQFPKEG